MGQRGKKSAASLSVVKPSSITAVARPDAPHDLAEDEAQVWLSVVNRMPADWFPTETHGLLDAYCRHAASVKHISELVDDLRNGKHQSEQWLQDYNKLMTMRERESRAMSALATRMRISQQAQYNHKKTTGSSVKKPWE